MGHSESAWGGGTTEYALEALLAAAKGESFVCPVDPDVRLPMIYVDDLMRGLLALQDADEAQLKEPERGYAIPGVSFTAHELFDEIRYHKPGFTTGMELNEHMNTFANLWPDTLSTEEAKRDLGYEARVDLRNIVFQILIAHKERLNAVKLPSSLEGLTIPRR